MIIKKKIKRVLEYFAAFYGKHNRDLDEPGLLILGYHRVLPKKHPEDELMQPGMKIRPETLEMHIQVLKQHFQIVSLSEWICKARAGEELPKKSVALTFDDGWIDNYEYAYPILKREQVPSTIFLVSSMIGTNKQFWPERVSKIISHIRSMKGQVFDEKQLAWFDYYKLDITNLRSFDEDVLSDFISRLKEFSDEDIYESLRVFSDVERQSIFQPQILNKEQLLEMKSSGLVSYGAHTRSHYRLNKIQDQQLLESETLGCKKDLESMLGINVSGFCYPNGDFNANTVDVLKKEYQYSCTTEKGWNTSKTDVFMLKRILVHDDVSSDPISFKARISGLI